MAHCTADFLQKMTKRSKNSRVFNYPWAENIIRPVENVETVFVFLQNFTETELKAKISPTSRKQTKSEICRRLARSSRSSTKFRHLSQIRLLACCNLDLTEKAIITNYNRSLK